MKHEWHLVAATFGGQGDILVVCTCDWGEIVPYVRGMEPGDARVKAEQLGRAHCLAANV